MNIVEIILFLSLVGACYSYFIYPLILLTLPKRNEGTDNVDSSKEIVFPSISFIITAYNEENNISTKIQNTLEISSPKNKIEILVASDGSTDKTNQIVNKYFDQGIKLIDVKERKGKENAQLAAIRQAKGDILVFSDVSTRIEEKALHHIINAFQDSKVGAVSSEDRFLTEDGKIAGEGAYVKYEMWLRKLESSVNSLVGLSGSFFAARKEVCENWDINVPSDFNTALNCVSHGYVAISHPEVLGYYPNLKDESKEYQRKLRTVIRGMAAIAHKPVVLNPFRYGLFSMQVFSHKIMRWMVPWFMLILLLISLSVWQQHILYTVILIGQLAFYSLAITGWLIESTRVSNLFKIPFFFMQVNIAIAHATIQFLTGKRITRWEPSKR